LCSKKKGVGRIMPKEINKVKEIDVAAVSGNKTLAAGIERRAVERCKEAIVKLGVVHTPVVGFTNGGKRVLLSGQCELTALRELGVKKMDAVEVDVTGDSSSKAKLSLMLISLQDKPGALCEGLLLQEAVTAGVSRREIQSMLGKSASWVSNRLSLVTRLDGNVYEMVRSGLLEPRTAQDIARLPTGLQFAFTEAALREGLPKSAVEALVACYNAEGCPTAVKEEILRDPRVALKRVADKRRAVNAGQADRHAAKSPMDIINGITKSLSYQMPAIRRALSSASPHESEVHRSAINELEMCLSEMMAMIRGIFSPGKMEVEHEAR
jgi:ParB-like chromosome segregation protein Spo0J